MKPGIDVKAGSCRRDMSVSKIGLIWLRLAVVYFVAGVALGVVMGASGNHSLFPVHAHMNLLGWVSMGLFAYVHDRYPQLGNNWLSRAQLWLYNLGLPVMLASLAAMLSGNASMDPVIGISSLVIGAAVLMFALNVLLNLRGGAAESLSALATRTLTRQSD